MSKDTRSKTTLPGNIRQYIIPTPANSTTTATMPGTPPPPTEPLDMQQLLTMMTRTMGTMSESRPTVPTKLEDCPLKRTSSSLDSWMKEVLLWNEINASTVSGWNAKKYLKFLDSVFKSEGCNDLKSLVQVEFVENEAFDKKKDTVIKEIIVLIEKKLGKTDIEKCSDAWLEFINIKQESGETATEYVSRFEKVESKLKNVKIIIPNKALAIHMMSRSNMEEQSKENVLTKTKLDDENDIYPSMKISIREMKGKLTRNDTPITKSAGESKTFYGERSEENHSKRRSGSTNRRHDSRSKDDLESWRKDQKERDYRNDTSTGRYRGNRSSSRHNNRNNRNSSRYNNRNGRSSSRYNRKERSSSRYNRGRDSSERRIGYNRKEDSESRSRQGRDSYRRDYRDYRRSSSKGREKSGKSGSSEEVNNVHFSEYCRHTISDNSETIKDACKHFNEINDTDREFIENVYSVGDCDIDPYKLVVDCGCPKTVAGRRWMDAFIESKGDVKIRLEKENERFRFGPSQVFTSKQNYEIEVHVGDLIDTIKVSVVDADVPLLLGLDYQTKWDMVIDVGRNNIHIRKSKQTFKLIQNPVIGSFLSRKEIFMSKLKVWFFM